VLWGTTPGAQRTKIFAPLFLKIGCFLQTIFQEHISHDP
jgi:hypothetical protein